MIEHHRLGGSFSNGLRFFQPTPPTSVVTCHQIDFGFFISVTIEMEIGPIYQYTIDELKKERKVNKEQVNRIGPIHRVDWTRLLATFQLPLVISVNLSI